jgi:hypothetical protein
MPFPMPTAAELLKAKPLEDEVRNHELRDRFAMAALPACLSTFAMVNDRTALAIMEAYGFDGPVRTEVVVSRQAYAVADAMLAERDRER